MCVEINRNLLLSKREFPPAPKGSKQGAGGKERKVKTRELSLFIDVRLL